MTGPNENMKPCDLFKRFIDPSNKLVWLSILFLTLLYRLYLCTETPTVTTDLWRNLGYTSHFSEFGFRIYHTLASDFLPEQWSKQWGNLGYIYPPFAACFFGFFSYMGLGFFWVKLVLTLLDLFSAFIISRHTSRWAGLLFFAAPVSAWYTSHEGQFESLNVFLMLLSTHFILRKKWAIGGFFWVLALQAKLFGLLLIPFFFFQFFSQNDNKSVLTKFSMFLFGVLAGVLPFMGFYINKPDILLIPLLEGTKRIYNPFSWNLFNKGLFGWNHTVLISWNAFWSYFSLVLLGGFFFYERSRDLVFRIFPVFSFGAIIKSLNWSQFWYTIQAPAFLLPLRDHKKLVITLLAIHFMQGGRSIALLAGYEHGRMEEQETVQEMSKCIYQCKFQE